MHTKKIKSICLLMASVLTLSACGNEEAKGVNKNSQFDYYRTMEEGQFYICHAADHSMEIPYVGKSSAKGEILWYKEDFDQIPTLYEGDRLVYYTPKVIDEKFVYRRFEDFGYSVGICQMVATTSRRPAISTKPDDGCTYPGGDTDELLAYPVEYVLMDTFAGVKVRIPETTYSEEEAKDGVLTRIGTINNLEKGKTYATKIYTGTELPKDFKFKADVHIFGLMDEVEKSDFQFVDGNVIELVIPEWFNSGYYTINGQGVFRLIRGTEVQPGMNIPDSPDYYNVPNVDPEKEEEKVESVDGNAFFPMEDEPVNPADEDKDDRTIEFDLSSEGAIQVTATFKKPDGSVEDAPTYVQARIIDPDENVVTSMRFTGDCLSANFYGNKTGRYRVEFFDLKGLEPKIEFK